nr:hypothetical protein Iba_chr12dCG9950 [Ipomoea batatas]
MAATTLLPRLMREACNSGDIGGGGGLRSFSGESNAMQKGLPCSQQQRESRQDHPPPNTAWLPPCFSAHHEGEEESIAGLPSPATAVEERSAGKTEKKAIAGRTEEGGGEEVSAKPSLTPSLPAAFKKRSPPRARHRCPQLTPNGEGKPLLCSAPAAATTGHTPAVHIP